MSEPTQQDRERAVVDARKLRMIAEASDFRPVPVGDLDIYQMARVLLALLAERETKHSKGCPAGFTDYKGRQQGNEDPTCCTCGFASGRRAGLLELADWCETKAHDNDPSFEIAMKFAASHARAMAEKEPSR